jgi:hypothetical protein
MGAEAVKFLVRLLEDGTRPPMNCLFKLPIILRESTAAAPPLRPVADLADDEPGPPAST